MLLIYVGICWDTLGNVVGTKILREIGMINKLKLIFLKEILWSIYNALILPHINYCLFSWGSGSAAKNIFLKQKRAIRAISGVACNAHTEPQFKIYKLYKIEDIMHKIEDTTVD